MERLAILVLLAATVPVAPALGQPSTFRFVSGGAINYDQRPDGATLAASVAPILWFSPEEQLRQNGRVSPQKIPCDLEPDRGQPVVYYRASQGPLKGRGTVPVIHFYFYYSYDLGPGCHSNDLETARVWLTNPEEDEFGIWAVSVIAVQSDAHGKQMLRNSLRVDDSELGDLQLPLTLLVGCFRHQVLLRRDRHVRDGSSGPPVRVSEHPYVA